MLPFSSSVRFNVVVVHCVSNIQKGVFDVQNFFFFTFPITYHSGCKSLFVLLLCNLRHVLFNLTWWELNRMIKMSAFGHVRHYKKKMEMNKRTMAGWWEQSVLLRSNSILCCHFGMWYTCTLQLLSNLVSISSSPGLMLLCWTGRCKVKIASVYFIFCVRKVVVLVYKVVYYCKYFDSLTLWHRTKSCW